MTSSVTFLCWQLPFTSLLQQPVTEAGLPLADRQLKEFYALTEVYYGMILSSIFSVG